MSPSAYKGDIEPWVLSLQTHESGGFKLSTCDIVSLWYTKSDMNSSYCHHCGAVLTAEPEPLEGEWAIPCWFCGARNVVVAVLKVVGWRL